MCSPLEVYVLFDVWRHFVRACGLICLQLSDSTSGEQALDEEPRFEQPLRHITVPKTKTAIFTCRLCGRPRPTVLWKAPNGQPLSIGDHK